MVTTIGEAESAKPYEKIAGSYGSPSKTTTTRMTNGASPSACSPQQPLNGTTTMTAGGRGGGGGTQIALNGETVHGSASAGASTAVLAAATPENAGLAPPQLLAQPDSASRLQSRRASTQSKELSTMELPDPSRLDEALRPVEVSNNRQDGLLSADLDPSPLVSSIPSSPYLGSTTPGSSTPGALPRFENTEKQDELVERLEKLVLPEPEILSVGSRRELREKERVAKEFGEVWSELDLPEPEYITRANLRAQGAKTPEPTVRSPGEVISNETALRRHGSVKKAAPNGSR